MKINIAKSAGFCFGVKRALDIALKTLKSSRKVYMLGDIVHNEDVVNKIKKLGIKKVDKLKNGTNRVLLIRAHGSGLEVFKKAGKLGYRIIDATCPMVKEIHKIARDMEEKGYRIIIIGDRAHDEVKGIMGQLKHKALVIDGKIPLEVIRGIKKAGVVVQSTQNLESALRAVAGLRKIIPQLRFANTICRPTRVKQDEIKNMPEENEAMVIIGSKQSANTKRLYEISRSLNRRTYWINSASEIKPAWFKGVSSVGVTAGASTPQDTIRHIVGRISKSL